MVWVDGRLGDAEEARVSPFDHGIVVGDGVFETLRVYRGVPFAWTRHLARLDHSPRLGLDVPPPATARSAGSRPPGQRPPGGEAAHHVTGGTAALGRRGRLGAQVIVAASAFRPWPPTVAVVVSPWPRNERSATAGLKTISYAENVVALGHARERGAGEAVFANTRGELCEATGSNVFVVSGGVVRTPPSPRAACRA